LANYRPPYLTYYLDWFSFHIVIMNVIGVNFFLKHSVGLLIKTETILFNVV